MANFNYNQYQAAVDAARDSDNKVGFFKLKDNGDEALVRINCASTDELEFASVHSLQANGKWMKISCLNPLGSPAVGDSCPLCAQVNAGNKAISKASKKVYLQMLVSYKDPATGEFSAAVPVIWERPAVFSRDIANLLRDYGSLKETVFKITRNGAAGDMKTTYSISFIPQFNSEQFIAKDFGAFANFKIARHSYYEKSLADIQQFLMTGTFPDGNATTAMPGAPAAPATPVGFAPAQPQFAPQAAPQTFVAPQQTFVPPATPAAPQAAPAQPYVTPTAPVAQPAPTMPQPQPVPAAPAVQPTQAPVGTPADRPVRTFGGFSF